MTKLNDTQLVLLSTAANREGGSLYPLAETLTPARTTKALTSLAKAGLAEEREVADAKVVHRTDGDLRFGLFITPAGLQAIGIEEGEGPRRLRQRHPLSRARPRPRWCWGCYKRRTAPALPT